jgi:hypothetical protein
VSELQFIASLVSSLTWPVAVVTIVLLFRTKLAELLSSGIRRLKAGPFEVEWDRTSSEVRVELDQPGVPSIDVSTDRGPFARDLAELTRISPTAAVVQGYARVEVALREKLSGIEDDAKLRTSAAGLARLAAQQNKITDETARAIEGLAILRNLAAHGGVRDMTTDRAMDYLVLVDAVLYILSK